MERLTSKVLRKSWRFLEYDWLAADSSWQQIVQSWLKELQNTSEELGGGELWSVSENHRKVSRVRSPIIHDPPQIDTMKHYVTQSDTIIIVLTIPIQPCHYWIVSEHHYND